MSVEDFLNNLDHVIHDSEMSPDAMRWTPDPVKPVRKRDLADEWEGWSQGQTCESRLTGEWETTELVGPVAAQQRIDRLRELIGEGTSTEGGLSSFEIWGDQIVFNLFPVTPEAARWAQGVMEHWERVRMAFRSPHTVQWSIRSAEEWESGHTFVWDGSSNPEPGEG